MSKYPVEIGDNEGQTDAINYMLSGSQGTGQNFSGYSAYIDKYLTGSQRPPFVNDTLVGLEVSVPLATTELLDEVTIKCTFASTQATVPFILGSGLQADGIPGALGATINLYGQTIGVVACTTDYAIIRLEFGVSGFAPGSGGTLTYSMFADNQLGKKHNTDCNAQVTVTNSTDRVFVSALLDAIYHWINVSGPWTNSVTVSITRYKSETSSEPTNDYYVYHTRETIIKKTYNYNSTTTTDLNILIDTVFTTIIDTPGPGYYFYVLSLEFGRGDTSTVYINDVTLQVRSLSAQVVKQ